jgi:hypothetical protein
VEAHAKRIPPHNPCWPYAVTRLGRLTFDKAGLQTVTLRPEQIAGAKKLGLTLVSVDLVPSKK